MIRFGRFAVPVGVFAALVAVFAAGLGKDPAVIPSPLIGKPAPSFTLTRLDDPARNVSTAEFAGRQWVLNVWGTWCPGCREEHEAVMKASRASGVPWVGLNWKDDRALALEWLEQLGNPYTVTAFDGDGRVAIDWGVYGAPETFLIGADGTVQHKQIGPLTDEIWQRDFVPRLAAAR